MPEQVTIKDFETDEEVAVLTDDGELHTEDEELQRMAKEMTDEGGVKTLVPGVAKGEDGYGDWTVTPDDEGFMRAFLEYLPSPYTVEVEEFRELPHMSPPDEVVPGSDATEKTADALAKAAAEAAENEEEKDAVTSATGGVSNDTYGGYDPDDLEEDEAADAAKSALSEVLSKEWTGPHEGERGGTYWLNTETNERRYQENEPEPSEGGGDSGDAGDAGDPGADPGAGGGGTTGGSFATEVTEGVYAEVQPIEPGNYPDPGDAVLVNGETVEATGDDFYAPDGEHHIQIEYAGRTMSVPVDEAEGVIGDEYNVGEYDGVDTEFELRLADAANAGAVVDELNARTIVTNVGKIDNEDLVFDALEQVVEGGAMSAERKLRGRARALGYTDDEIDERLGLTRSSELPEGHAEFKEAYSPSNVVESGGLPGMGGVNEGAMSYKKLENGEHAYVIDYEHSAVADIGGRDNAMVSYTFLRELLPDEGAVVPPYKLAEDGSWLAKKEVDGEPLRKAPRDWKAKTAENAEEITDAYAVQVLVANSDLHGNNQFIDEEGRVAFIDNDDTQDRAYGATDSGLDMVFRRMSLPSGVKSEYGGEDAAKEEIRDKAVQKAKELHESDELESIIEMAEEEAHEPDEVIDKVRDTVRFLANESYGGRYS